LEEKRRLGRYKVRRVGPREKEIPDDNTIRLPVVIKADVDGSVEAMLDVLDTYDCHDQCRLDIVHYGKKSAHCITIQSLSC
jgi:translation initiation factor IF-2